ncbi:MAG: hypothetical protein ACRC3H_05335 [Lachnospiraceae bacterium]
MARESKVMDKLRELGVEPIENKCIVVQYAAPNLSEQVARFIIQSSPFYVLQVCKDALVLAVISWVGGVKDEEPLKIPVSRIKSITVTPDNFNYRITIVCDDGDVNLVTQQKELALFRNSGLISGDNFWGTKSWHVNNMDATLKALETLVAE